VTTIVTLHIPDDIIHKVEEFRGPFTLQAMLEQLLIAGYTHTIDGDD
jgi:hypothetical protein